MPISTNVAAGRWYTPGNSVYSTNITDHPDVAEILNTMTPPPFPVPHDFTPGFSGVRVTWSLVFCAMFCRSLFVLFVLFRFVIVLSVLLRLTASDYPFDIFKLFSSWVFSKWDEWFTIKFDKMIIKSPHFGDWQHVKWRVKKYFHILSEQNVLQFMVISTILLLFSLICVDLRKQSICKQ